MAQVNDGTLKKGNAATHFFFLLLWLHAMTQQSFLLYILVSYQFRFR